MESSIEDFMMYSLRSSNVHLPSYILAINIDSLNEAEESEEEMLFDFLMKTHGVSPDDLDTYKVDSMCTIELPETDSPVVEIPQ